MWLLFVALTFVLGLASSDIDYELEVTNKNPYSFAVSEKDHDPIVINSAVFAGTSNDTVAPVGEDSQDTVVEVEPITSSIFKVSINSSLGFTGALFDSEEDERYYGVWGYPWNASLENRDISFDLKGLQNTDGINYLSARSPFFLSSAGYAVYTDTLAMGSYNFDTEGQEVQFIFNSTKLEYYLILPTERNNIKSLFEQYVQLSDATALWSPKSYGPMFWHDDFQKTSGFPDGVGNAQKFVEDVADKLYENRIRASTIMVDRP